MSFRLPRVYPLTDVKVSGLTHAEQVRRLAAGGATIVQLREKELSANDFYQQAKSAVQVARELGVKLIINDRVDLALAVGADGVHLGQEDLPPHAARNLLGPAAIIGVSTHNVTQALAALDLPIDYLAIGPIFPTRTKTDTAPELGLTGLGEVRKAVGHRPLVAIGGITEANAAQVIQAGADSVALISSLLSNPETIPARTASFLRSLV